MDCLERRSSDRRRVNKPHTVKKLLLLLLLAVAIGSAFGVGYRAEKEVAVLRIELEQAVDLIQLEHPVL